MKDKSSHSLYRVSDELWEKIEPLLPQHTHPRELGGRPRVPDRQIMNGILFVLRTGCQWKALDETNICSGSTAHSRFQEWMGAGFFQRLWQMGLEKYDELKGLDWSWQAMDGAMTKAPLGGEKNRSQPYGPRQRGRQTQRADRVARGSHRLGGRRGQPSRLQTGPGDAGKHSDFETRAHDPEPSESLSG